MKKIKILFLSVSILFNTGLYLHSQDLNETISSVNQFTFSLYEKINNEEENVFFSPYSVSSALAMTYNGAKGTTKKEMSKVLYFSEDTEKLSSGFMELNNTLHGKKRKEIQLNIANSLWCEQDFELKQEFLDLNSKYYSAGVKKVDFQENYKNVREDINTWVAGKTNDKIQNLIQKGMLDPMTRLVLVNAIYFKGMWEFPFKPERTKEDTFYIYSKCMTKADFMNRTLSARYYKDDLARVIEIPYSGKELSMMIVMPLKRYGMKELEERLDEKRYNAYRNSMYTTRVKLSLPKFRINAGYELSDPLSKLGMSSAFGKDANFAGISGKEELFINNIVHKSFVEVNEEGTEAAAATGVVMRKTTAIVDTVEFEADHPFIFFIKDNKTGTILFMGRVMNPEE